MKKIAPFLSFLFVVAACSSDESNQAIEENDGILLQSFINADTGVGTKFYYNGFKLDSLEYGDETGIFEYTGSEITRIKFYEMYGGLTEDWTLTYSNGNLVQITAWEQARLLTTTYNFEYPDANTMTAEVHLSYPPGIDAGGFLCNQVYETNQSGDITQIETTYDNGSITTQSFAYDNKKYPLRNILGFGQLSYFLKERVPKGIRHNVVQDQTDFTKLFDFSYGSNDYPASHVLSVVWPAEGGPFTMIYSY